MTPFLQFRVWLRTGPMGERVSAALAAALAVAVLGWALVPLATDDTAQIATDGAFGASDTAGAPVGSVNDEGQTVDPRGGPGASSPTAGGDPSGGDVPGSTSGGAGTGDDAPSP